MRKEEDWSIYAIYASVGVAGFMLGLALPMATLASLHEMGFKGLSPKHLHSSKNFETAMAVATVVSGGVGGAAGVAVATQLY